MLLALRTTHSVRIAYRSTSTRFLSTSHYEHVLVSRPHPAVALITLNRPKALNALNAALFRGITSALKDSDMDDTIGAMVITGSDKAFAGVFTPP